MCVAHRQCGDIGAVEHLIVVCVEPRNAGIGRLHHFFGAAVQHGGVAHGHDERCNKIRGIGTRSVHAGPCFAAVDRFGDGEIDILFVHHVRIVRINGAPAAVAAVHFVPCKRTLPLHRPVILQSAEGDQRIGLGVGESIVKLRRHIPAVSSRKGLSAVGRFENAAVVAEKYSVRIFRIIKNCMMISMKIIRRTFRTARGHHAVEIFVPKRFLDQSASAGIGFVHVESRRQNNRRIRRMNSDDVVVPTLSAHIIGVGHQLPRNAAVRRAVQSQRAVRGGIGDARHHNGRIGGGDGKIRPADVRGGKSVRHFYERIPPVGGFVEAGIRRGIPLAARKIHDTRIEMIDRHIHRHQCGIDPGECGSGIVRTIGPFGSGGKNRRRFLGIDDHPLYGTILRKEPGESRCHPCFPPVRTFDDAEPVRGPRSRCADESQIVSADLSGADVHFVRIRRVDGDRFHRKDVKSGRHIIPRIFSHAAGGRTPESAAGAAGPDHIAAVGIERQRKRTAADVVRPDRLPRFFAHRFFQPAHPLLCVLQRLSEPVRLNDISGERPLVVPPVERDEPFAVLFGLYLLCGQEIIEKRNRKQEESGEKIFFHERPIKSEKRVW